MYSGGVVRSQESRITPQGVCDRVLQGKQSFPDGKRLRMGHYAVILQPYRRFALKGKLVSQQMAHKIRIGQDIDQGQRRRDINHVDQ